MVSVAPRWRRYRAYCDDCRWVGPGYWRTGHGAQSDLREHLAKNHERSAHGVELVPFGDLDGD
ncbi:hypothetical protein EDD28_0020 [Salana multivorans]|uniref:Uncharacterized protein n=1 Tax=Salana multivorans TaxID=120377 RepID=A0A3N2D6Q6_9MICO|nr:hypothetical protein EDD28_2484 [Salana multivorans]ROR95467.1 hypothetical protein EDD28_0020 [Salana multivorans]